MSKIRVINKQTGQSGMLSEEYFNEEKYQRIDETQGEQAGSITDWFPAVGGIIGSKWGTKGAMAGSGIGETAKQILDKIDKNRNTDLDPSQIGMSTLLGGVGNVGGKLLGKLLNPIRSLAGFQDTLLKKAPGMINIAEQEAPGQAASVMSRLGQTTVPQLQQKGFGRETLEALNAFKANVGTAVSSYTPHIPAGAGKDIAPLSLPRFEANQLKRSFGQGIRDAYGKMGTAEEELKKGFIKILGMDIKKGRPDIDLLNKAMQLLYIPRNIGAGATHLLGLGGGPAYYAGASLRRGGQALSSGLGKLGDVSKYLLPGLFQARERE